MPFLSDQDISDIRFGVRHQVDFIAASFVSEPEDVLKLKELVEQEGARPPLYPKSKHASHLKTAKLLLFPEGLMVARGDLGVEIPAEEVPVVQRQIIDARRAAGRTGHRQGESRCSAK